MSEFGHLFANGRGFCIDIWGAGPFVIEVNGKSHTFEDSDRFGPSILRKDGDIADRQPGEKHPFWCAHAMWVKGGRRLEDDGKTCIWDPPEPTIIRSQWEKGRRYAKIVKAGDPDWGTYIEEVPEEGERP